MNNALIIDLPPPHLALLQRVARLLGRGVEGIAFAEATLADLSDQLHATCAHLLLLSREGEDLVRSASVGLPQAVDRLHLNAMPVARTALNVLSLIQFDSNSTADDAPSMPLWLREYDADALGAELHLLLPPAWGTLLFAPLTAQGRAAGALVICTPPERSLSTADVALADLVGTAIAASVVVSRLTEGVVRRNEQFAMVADIAARVSSSLDPREVYRLVVQKLSQYFRVEAGSLLIKDEATDELIFVMTLEAGEEKLQGVRVPPGRGIAGYVARTQEPYIANDAKHDPLRYARYDDQAGFNFDNMLCVPMVVKDNTIGVIELINKLDGPFTDKDAQRLMAAANVIGVAIENARLFEFVRQRRDRLDSLISAFSKGMPPERLIELLTRELQVQESMLVTKFNNPYIVGQPVLKPDMYYGREALIQRILSTIHQNSLLLHGERRIGKTSTLRQLQLRLHSANDPEYRFRAVYIDLQGISEEQFFAQIIEEITHHFGAPADALELRYQPDVRTYSGHDFHHDLRTIVTTLCGPQPDGRIDRLVLLIDEVDVMYGYDERVLQEFRRVFMSRFAVYLSAVLVAVNVQHVWKRYESPLYNLFKQIEVAPFARADAELLIRNPVRGRYEYEDAAVELIYELSAGRPIRIQHLCMDAIDELRDTGRTVVTVDDILRIGAVLKEREVWT